MLVLFQRETCPDCKPVRELLTRLQVSYININVPKPREERHELIRTTGSKFIPALVDGATVIPGRLRENADIIAYLKERFGDPDELAARTAGDSDEVAARTAGDSDEVAAKTAGDSDEVAAKTAGDSDEVAATTADGQPESVALPGEAAAEPVA
ncbi:glutaredoxin domain-containing protein [Streptomyces sp. G1]|uniref:glutaredoxin domain-containing protein n=1 Tax=Streptomyces sp. G1 TaxID=361572 RepID=UPI00202F647E|nr:glutaredoxin domain-containing protein [Streptomyces sp. G1]MCM1974044.1 glutathione S-transferase N-terminal domain-containing protein [Streptomyces sp. G1]